MQKKIFILVLGLLLIGANVYAAGDLQVNGSLGVGTTPASNFKAKVTTTNTRAMAVTATMDQNGLVAADTIQGLNLKAEMTGSSTGYAQGLNLLSVISTTAATANSAMGGSFSLSLASSASGTTTVTETVAGKFDTVLNPGNHTYNVTNGYGFNLMLRDFRNSGTGSLHFTNYKGINLQNPDNAYGALSVDTLAGVWIDQQLLGGTKNYGIVLDGNGAGADIVFGDSQEARIYSSGGRLWAQDSANNKTIFSPHDPITGEWIFYSQNIKTGKTVHVNMEKLVKAVEKLTGEKFMVESIEEIK
jgi:hypothetical protein